VRKFTKKLSEKPQYARKKIVDMVLEMADYSAFNHIKRRFLL